MVRFFASLTFLSTNTNLFNDISELDANTAVIEEAPDRKGIPRVLVNLGSLGWKSKGKHHHHTLRTVPKATSDLIKQMQMGECLFNSRINLALRV